VVESPRFDAAGLSGMRLRFFPKGHAEARGNHCSAYLIVPGRRQVTFELSVDDGAPRRETHAFTREAEDRGWHDMAPAKETYRTVSATVIESVEEMQVSGHTVSWAPMLAVGWRDFRKGDVVESPRIDAAGLSGMRLRFFPKGHAEARGNHCSAYLVVPGQRQATFELSVDDGAPRRETHAFTREAEDRGWHDMAPAKERYRTVCVKVFPAV